MEHKSLRYKNMDIHYWTSGNPRGDAALLLHPAFSDHNVFKMQIDELGKEFFLIIPDMVSHGMSQVGNSNTNMGDMPEIIDIMLEDNGIRAAHVLGVSMGSLAAQGFADKYPEKIISVCLVGGYSIHRCNEAILRKQNLEMLKWFFMIVFSMKIFKKYILNVSVESDMGREAFSEGLEHFRLSSFRGMGGMDKIFRKSTEPLKYPLMVICGEHDQKIIIDSCKSLVEVEKTAEYFEIKDAGHCANIDSFENFNTLYMKFTKSI